MIKEERAKNSPPFHFLSFKKKKRESEDEEVGVLMDNEFDSDSNNTVHNCILSRLKLLGIVGSESHLEHVSQ